MDSSHVPLKWWLVVTSLLIAVKWAFWNQSNDWWNGFNTRNNPANLEHISSVLSAVWLSALSLSIPSAEATTCGHKKGRGLQIGLEADLLINNHKVVGYTGGHLKSCVSCFKRLSAHDLMISFCAFSGGDYRGGQYSQWFILYCNCSWKCWN